MVHKNTHCSLKHLHVALHVFCQVLGHIVVFFFTASYRLDHTPHFKKKKERINVTKNLCVSSVLIVFVDLGCFAEHLENVRLQLRVHCFPFSSVLPGAGNRSGGFSPPPLGRQCGTRTESGIPHFMIQFFGTRLSLIMSAVSLQSTEFKASQDYLAHLQKNIYKKEKNA